MNSEIKQTCILIPGMHRSGTSALAGTLSFLDIYLGSELMEASSANKKGYFENNLLFKINERLLAEINSSWDDVFYDEAKAKVLKNADELKNTVINEFEYSNLFAIKDPRLVYLFRVYEQTLQELNIDIKIILPYRNPAEVANSLNRRDNMPMEKGMLLWAYHFLLAEKFSRNYERVFVNFDELISNTSEVISQISSKLSIPLDEQYEKNQAQIDDFLEPKLKNHNISIKNLSDKAPKIVKDILSLEEQFNDVNNQGLTSAFDKLRDELFSYKKLFYNDSIIKSLSEGKTAGKTLQTKEQELGKTKQTLQSKEQELGKTKQTLQSKEQELGKTKQTLQTKELELGKTKQTLQSKEQELEKLYTSKSWKLTSPFRKLRRVLLRIKNGILIP